MPEEQGKKKSSIPVGLLIAILVPVPILTYFFVPTISEWSAISGSIHLIFLIPDNIAFVIAYITIPIFYCAFISLLFQPKRMVQPLYIQFVTFFAVALMVVNNASVTIGKFPAYSNVIMLYLGLSIGFSFMLFLAIGFVQWFSVRWLIRMNFEDCDRVSYIVNMPPKEILHKLGQSFLDEWSFSREKDLGENWFLKRGDANLRNLVIELGPHPNDDKKSILATVAYEYNNDWIVKTSSASNIRETLLAAIEKKIGLKFQESQTDLDNSISRLAERNVKDLAHSRIENVWRFLRTLPSMYKIILSVTVSALFILSIVYFNFNQNNYLSSDTYIGTTIALVIGFFIEIGFPLREEIAKKKRDEIDF